jgi:hypothetical protein
MIQILLLSSSRFPIDAKFHQRHQLLGYWTPIKVFLEVIVSTSIFVMDMKRIKRTMLMTMHTEPLVSLIWWIVYEAEMTHDVCLRNWTKHVSWSITKESFSSPWTLFLSQKWSLLLETWKVDRVIFSILTAPWLKCQNLCQGKHETTFWFWKRKGLVMTISITRFWD